MTTRLAVIGLDQVGVSFGLALADYMDQVFRCGHDPAPSRLHKVNTEGAFDKIYFRLSEAVRDADVILLNVPIDQIEITLKDMSEDVKDGAIVINTSRLSVAVADWAARTLSAGRQFITMTPALNGAYLLQKPVEALIPHADLFTNSKMIISTNSGTHADAVDMVLDLTSLVGAQACFTDPGEADGLLAKIDTLPRLFTTALLHSTMNQPGWQDTKTMASEAFAQSTNAVQLFNETEHPALGIVLNRDNTLLALDGLIASLIEIRSWIELKDQTKLDDLITELRDGHADWQADRIEGDRENPSHTKMEKPAGTMKLFFGDPSKIIKK